MSKEYLILWDNYVFYKDGRIYSKYFKRFLKGKITKDGYVQVSLKCIDGKNRTFYCHRVIWTYFNGTIPEGMQVNHINEVKTDNRLSNLEIVTPKENINWGTGIERRAAKRRGRNQSEETKRKISDSHKRILRGIPRPDVIERIKILLSKEVVAVDKNNNVVMEFASTREAERQDFNHVAVCRCCNNCYGKLGNYYKGYYWYYKEDWEKFNSF